MRNGLKFLFTLLLAAGIAACDAGDEAEFETLETEETVTPGLEPGMTGETGAAIVTAQFQPVEGAAAQNVTGTVRIFAESGAYGTTPTTTTPDATPGTTGAAGEAATADPATTETDVAAEPMGGAAGFRIEAELNGLTEGDHAWHIHQGACSEKDAPVAVAISETVGMDGIGDELEAENDGRARGTATVPAEELSLSQLQAGQFSLHVHERGGEDHGPAVACADLGNQTSTM